MTADDPLNHVLNARLVYHLPGEDRVKVIHDVLFATTDEGTLHCDIYLPDALGADARRPAVLFVSGDTPPEYAAGVKQWGVYVGWGRLVAAAGFVGVAFQHRVMHQLQEAHLEAVVADVDAVVQFARANADAFHIDPERLCLWCGSAGAVAGLRVGLRGGQPFLRCLVSYYGLFDLALYAAARQLPTPPPEILARFAPLRAVQQRPHELPPLLIARMEHDIEGLNAAVDAFVLAAEEAGASVMVLNHPHGHHGFDTEDDDDRSRAIIAETLAFMERHLGEETASPPLE